MTLSAVQRALLYLGLSIPAGQLAAQVSPTDSAMAVAQQEYFELLDVDVAWNMTRGDGSCVVGIVDTGFDFFHPSMVGVLAPGYFAPGVFHTPNIEVSAHGTAVASVIVARAGDSVGMTGFAPGCRAIAASTGMPDHVLMKLQQRVRAENPEATMRDIQREMMGHAAELQQFGVDWVDHITASVSDGVRYLVDKGATVINLSTFLSRDILGQYPEFAARLDEAFEYAEVNDVVLVVGAGNNGSRVTDYPGTAEGTLVVGASTLDDERWVLTVEQMGTTITQGSAYGPRLSVLAPSVDIVTAMPHERAFYDMANSPTGASKHVYLGSYRIQPAGATSMATPVVAALAGLIRSLRPDLSARSVVQLIQQTAVDLGDPGYDEMTGHGRVDFGAALNAARNHP